MNIEKALEEMRSWIEYEKNNKDKILRADDLIDIQETIIKEVDRQNKIIRQAYAKANKIPFVNYYKAMVVDENQALNPQYTKDGVHPTSEGYDIMEPLIKNAIEKAL